jgi:PncC family amidohydrolase
MFSPISKELAELQQICQLRGWKIGLAESCTGGLLSSWIAQQPGISKIFQGAVVSYVRSAKEQILGVRPEMITTSGVVSEAVAISMARGARAALAADWAVSITGIVGPTGGSPEKPVGTVCFAVVGPDFEDVTTHNFDQQLERQEIQRQAAIFVFKLLLRALRQANADAANITALH